MPDPTPEATPAASTIPADRLKYLEMLQAIIGRMSTNSSTLKGWTVTLVAALVALAAKDGNLWCLAVGLIPILLFAGLDGYYLHLERGYRRLFDRAANSDHPIPLFNLHRDPMDRGIRQWLRALGRPIVWTYYLAVLVSLVVAIVIFVLAQHPTVSQAQPQKPELGAPK